MPLVPLSWLFLFLEEAQAHQTFAHTYAGLENLCVLEVKEVPH